MRSMVLEKNHFLFWYMGLIFSIILFCTEYSVATDSISRSGGISVGQTLISPGQIFELGFFSPNNSAKLYVGIWYNFNSTSKQKPVWVANRDSPLTITDTGSSLAIGNDGNLEILDGERKMVWSTNVSSPQNGTIAVLSDLGELRLKDSAGSILWGSFTYPGDSFISGMSIGANSKTGEKRFLCSWKTDDDPSTGDFTYGLTTETPPQIFVWKNSQPYRRGGPWDGWRFIGFHETQKGYSNGLIVTPDNDQGTAYLTYNTQSNQDVILIQLTPDGNVKMSQWTRGTSEGGLKWVAQQIFCEIYGTCGSFGFCDRTKTKTCQCLKGFVPKLKEEWSKGNWTSGCLRRSELLCQNSNSTLSSNKSKSDGFFKLSEMKVPDHHVYLFKFDALGCKQQCLSNCSCVAYAYVKGINCMIWVGDLIDTQQFSGTGADLFIRVAYSELGRSKKKMKLIIILTTISGAIFLVAFIMVLYKCAENRKVMRRRRINQFDSSDRVDTPIGGSLKNNTKHDMTQMISSELPMFDFITLKAATKNFSETNKLGEGGFGPVYRGKLEDGQEIAVKRLSSHSGQGAVEFKNEILLISKLQHRNLVKLLGFCIEGDEKLLVYEYLRNKSLDTFLFDTTMKSQLNWSRRFDIIVGIARGLLYLHRDSCLRIIHRDLKAGNILLDDNMNPKISDFGLARAFDITQELRNTHRVVGTFGYISPEYAVGGIVSEKSDVFSFGVLVLEILSGLKVGSFSSQEDYLNLLGHAWQLWEEGKGLTLMDKQMSLSCSETEFMNCLQIALICIQDHAADRPTMPAVVLMLSSDTTIPRPRQATLCQGLVNSGLHFNSKLSKNDISLSMVEGRLLETVHITWVSNFSWF